MKKYHFFHESLLLLFKNVGKIILETSFYYLYFMRGAPPPGGIPAQHILKMLQRQHKTNKNPQHNTVV